MALQIRRGTSTELKPNQGIGYPGIKLALGELVYTTDEQKIYIGDGTTFGGVDLLANMAGAVTSVNGNTGAVVLTTDDITEGDAKYFTDAKAVNAVGTKLVANNPDHVGISFTWDGTDLIATATAASQTSLISDTNPRLGANLGLNTYSITGIGSIGITGNIEATDTVTSSKVITNSITPSGSLVVNAGTAAPLVTVKYNSNGSTPTRFELAVANGTASVPTNTAAGNYLGSFKVSGYYGGDYKFASSIITQWDSDADLTKTFPKSSLLFITNDNTDTQGSISASLDGFGKFSAGSLYAGDGTASAPGIGFTSDASMDTGFYHPGDGIIGVTINGQEKARFDGGGMRVNGFMKVAQVNGTLPNPPEAGMIVLDGTTFKGYNGSGWVNLN